MACVCTRSDCWDQMTIDKLRKENIMKAFVTALTLTLAACSVYAKEYHVSKAGVDGNPGTKSKPFKTISAAADRILLMSGI